MLRYLPLFAVLVMTAYGQLIVKSRALVHAAPGESGGRSLHYLFSMFTDIGVLSGIGVTFLAGIIYMMTIARMDLGLAYPFMALSFVVVPVSAAFLFGESFSGAQFFGSMLIVAGVTVNTLAR